MISVSEAATITGETIRTWQRRAEKEVALAKQQFRSPLAILCLPANGGKHQWGVSPLLDKRLRASPSRESSDVRERAGLLARFPSHSVELAYRRHYWLMKWRERCNQRRQLGTSERSLAEDVVREARIAEGESFKVSVRSLALWWRKYKMIGADRKRLGVEGLVDRYGSGKESSDGLGVRDPAAVDWFYSLYRAENKLSGRMCHDCTVCEARKRGWAWPGSYTSTTRWLRERDDVSLTFLLRNGRDRWARRFLSHIECDEDSIGPADLYVADHHRLDIWCSHRDKQIRPWITTIQDRKSRCIVGWHVGPVPHTDAIVMTMRMAFKDWAIPDTLKVDCGKDFNSSIITLSKDQRRRLRSELGEDWLTIVKRNAPQADPIDTRWLGIAQELGINLQTTIPYSPWSKGCQERFYRRLEEQHGRTYATWCGNSAVNRPECLQEIKRGYSKDQKRRLKKLHGSSWRKAIVLKLVDQSDVPTIEDVRKGIGEWIEAYHLSPHRGLSGATPMAVWQTAGSLKQAVAEDLLCLTEIRGVFKVTGNGVRLTVGQAAISYGKSSAALKRYVGRDVLIRMDPQDVSVCWAYTPDRDKHKPIGRLEPNERLAPNTTADDAREAIAEQMRERSVMHKAARSSARRTRTAVERINRHTREAQHLLRQTGTDSAVPAPACVLVRTGFEGVSEAGRSDVARPEYCPPDPEGMSDLFMDEPVEVTEDDDDHGLEDLFDDAPKPSPDDDGGGLEELLP